MLLFDKTFRAIVFLASASDCIGLIPKNIVRSFKNSDLLLGATSMACEARLERSASTKVKAKEKKTINLLICAPEFTSVLTAPLLETA